MSEYEEDFEEELQEEEESEEEIVRPQPGKGGPLIIPDKKAGVSPKPLFTPISDPYTAKPK